MVELLSSLIRLKNEVNQMKKLKKEKSFYLIFGIALALLIGAIGVVVPDSDTCTDSDGGKNYYEKGTVEMGVTVTDTCSGNTLSEGYCKGKGGGYPAIQGCICPNGCEDGACLPIEKEIEIELISPKDKEIVLGIVSIEVTVTGVNTLGGVDLTIEGAQPFGHLTETFQLTDCTDNVMQTVCEYKKTCHYDWDTSNWQGKQVIMSVSTSDNKGNTARDSITPNVPARSCTDSDGGIDYYVSGYVVADGINYWDFCSAGGGLTERLCTKNGMLVDSWYACPNGCDDGACKPYITVNFPKGGEDLFTGNSYEITWESGGVDNVHIGLQGPSSRTIANSIPASVGRYSWTVPDDVTLAENYKILIGSSVGSVSDESDSYFSICSYEMDELDIEITSPEDGEKVSGTVRVEATATGTNTLGGMYLTIARANGAGSLKLTDCTVAVALPLCMEGGECKTTYQKTCYLNWDTSSYEGDEVTLTATISDSGGNTASDPVTVSVLKRIDLVDVDIYPETQTVRTGALAVYKIVVTDNHPLLRCGIEFADETASEENVEKATAARCHVYYNYKIDVTGLPFDAEYSQSVTLYQGSSTSIPLTIKPTYAGNFAFAVKVTLSSNQNVYDSDSARLVVNEFSSCDLACRRRGYDYGVCRTSCRVDEYGIGTNYCPQLVDEALTTSSELVSIKTATAVKTVAVKTGDIRTVEATGTTAEPMIVTKTERINATISRYPRYQCCCGNKGINLDAWPGKSTYESGEVAKIYAKVYSTDNGDVSADVKGTVTRPDGGKDDLVFKKVCEIREIQSIKDENPSMEIYCVGDSCSPRCLYVSTYGNTGDSGYYSVAISAKSSQGSVEKTIRFSVKKELESCNNYCQGRGYDYGVCRTSCREGERNSGTGYCSQLISTGKSEIYLFYSPTCSHCDTEKAFLTGLEERYDGLEIHYVDVAENRELLAEMCERYGVKITSSVPMTFVGDMVFVGFADEEGPLTYLPSYGCYQGYRNQITVALEERYRYTYCCCGNLVPPPLPEDKLRLELHEGWNLIALPGKGELSLGNCGNLYGFVYIDGKYLSMTKAREKLGDEGLMEYLSKNSFWAYSFKECYLEFTLEEYTSYTELELSKGWNFLPITEDMVGRNLDEIRGDCEFQKRYIWNAESQKWENLDMRDEFSEGQKFEGILVKVESHCSLGSVVKIIVRPIDVSYTPEEPQAGELITITVLDRTREDPLEDVEVDVFLGTRKIEYGLTDDDGIFEFTPPEAGTYSVELSKSSYRPEELSITVI
jgi:thiol-disulfide isomerase/thioredoxin